MMLATTLVSFQNFKIPRVPSRMCPKDGYVSDLDLSNPEDARRAIDLEEILLCMTSLGEAHNYECYEHIDTTFVEPSECPHRGEKLRLCDIGNRKSSKCVNDTANYCSKCEPGKTFTLGINNCTKCFPCTKCRDDEVVAMPCNIYEDAVCMCPIVIVPTLPEASTTEITNDSCPICPTCNTDVKNISSPTSWPTSICPTCSSPSSPICPANVTSSRSPERTCPSPCLAQHVVIGALALLLVLVLAVVLVYCCCKRKKADKDPEDGHQHENLSNGRVKKSEDCGEDQALLSKASHDASSDKIEMQGMPGKDSGKDSRLSSIPSTDAAPNTAPSSVKGTPDKAYRSSSIPSTDAAPDTPPPSVKDYGGQHHQKTPMDVLCANCDKYELKILLDPSRRNGDCFFDSVVDQMKRLKMKDELQRFCHDKDMPEAEKLRHELVKYMKPQIDETFAGEKNEWINHCEKMDKAGTWIDDWEVKYMAKMLNKEITVIGSEPKGAIQECSGYDKEGRRFINGDKTNVQLRYILLGHIVEQHYLSLGSISDHDQHPQRNLAVSSTASMINSRASSADQDIKADPSDPPSFTRSVSSGGSDSIDIHVEPVIEIEMDHNNNDASAAKAVEAVVAIRNCNQEFKQGKVKLQNITRSSAPKENFITSFDNKMKDLGLIQPLDYSLPSIGFTLAEQDIFVYPTKQKQKLLYYNCGAYVRYTGSVHQVTNTENLLRIFRNNSPEYRTCPIPNKNQIIQGHKFPYEEGTSVEFKTCGGNIDNFISKEIPKYVSAFANTSGGLLVMGVNDERKITGIPATGQCTFETSEKIKHKIETLTWVQMQIKQSVDKIGQRSNSEVRQYFELKCFNVQTDKKITVDEKKDDKGQADGDKNACPGGTKGKVPKVQADSGKKNTPGKVIYIIKVKRFTSGVVFTHPPPYPYFVNGKVEKTEVKKWCDLACQYIKEICI